MERISTPFFAASPFQRLQFYAAGTITMDTIREPVSPPIINMPEEFSKGKPFCFRLLSYCVSFSPGLEKPWPWLDCAHGLSINSFFRVMLQVLHRSLPLFLLSTHNATKSAIAHTLLLPFRPPFLPAPNRSPSKQFNPSTATKFP